MIHLATRPIFVVTLLLLAFLLPSPALARKRPGNKDSIEIKAHIISTDSVKLAAAGGGDLVISDTDGGKKRAQVPSGTIFSLKEGKFLAGEKNTDQEALYIRPEKEKELLLIQGKPYRGTVALKKKKTGGFFVVNHVDMEDYLCGVLGGEVAASWPEESLKAQAVAARTYALYRKKLPRDADFDVYSTVMDQMYIGQTAETPRLTDAIEKTAGEVLVYRDNIIKAYFHSTCGGHTEDGLEVFPDDGGWIKGVPCPYCKDSPGFAWEKKLTTGDISKALAKNGTLTGEICDIKIVRTDRTGRAADIVITTTDGEKTLKGSELRMLIGPGVMRSTKLRMKILEEKRESVPAERTARWVVTEKSPVLISGACFNEILCYTAFGPLSPSLALPLNRRLEMEAPGCMPTKMSSRYLKLVPGQEMQKLTATYHFSGEGWGHGVGMCQWGACRMAALGSTYRQILQFYYPGAAVVKAGKEK